MSRLTLEALLRRIAAGAPPTVGQLASATGLPVICIDGLVRRLEGAGHVEQSGPHSCPTWRVTRRGTAALARLNGGSK